METSSAIPIPEWTTNNVIAEQIMQAYWKRDQMSKTIDLALDSWDKILSNDDVSQIDKILKEISWGVLYFMAKEIGGLNISKTTLYSVWRIMEWNPEMAEWV